MKRNEIIELACEFGAYFELDFPDTIRSVDISPEGFFKLIETIIERHKVTQFSISNEVEIDAVLFVPDESQRLDAIRKLIVHAAAEIGKDNL